MQGPAGTDPAAPRASLDFVCPSEDSARAEAERRNRDNADPELEWIYLRNAEQQWVARRVERHPPIVEESERSRPWWNLLGEALQQALNLYH